MLPRGLYDTQGQHTSGEIPMDSHPGNKMKSTLESNLHQGNIYKTLEDLDKLEKITREHLGFGN